MESYKIRLPNGDVVDREFEKEEVEYWLSIGMYLGHSFHHITAIFQAEQENEEVDDLESEDDEDYDTEEVEDTKGPTIN